MTASDLRDLLELVKSLIMSQPLAKHCKGRVPITGHLEEIALQKSIVARLTSAKDHSDTPPYDWEKVFRTDEMMVELSGKSTQHYV